MCYAFLRVLNESSLERGLFQAPLDMYYRADFLVEITLDSDEESATQRQLDELVSPAIISLWMHSDGDILNESDPRLSLLTLPFDKTGE